MGGSLKASSNHLKKGGRNEMSKLFITNEKGGGF